MFTVKGGIVSVMKPIWHVHDEESSWRPQSSDRQPFWTNDAEVQENWYFIINILPMKFKIFDQVIYNCQSRTGLTTNSMHDKHTAWNWCVQKLKNSIYMCIHRPR